MDQIINLDEIRNNVRAIRPKAWAKRKYVWVIFDTHIPPIKQIGIGKTLAEAWLNAWKTRDVWQ